MPRVRGTARVGPPTTGRSGGPAILVRQRRPDFLGPVYVLQLVLLEAAAVAIVLTGRDPVLLLVTALPVGLLLVLAFGRRGGRWWLERIVIRARYRRRLASGRLAADDPRLAALHHLVPDLAVRTVTGLDGAEVGVGRDGAGSFAAVMIVPPAGVRGDPAPPPPLAALARLVADAERPGAVLQLVTHTVPAPGIALGGTAPAAASYRELLTRYGVTVPADQVTWVAVRYDARALADTSPPTATSPVTAGTASAGGSAGEEGSAVLAALVRRVARALKRAGLEYRILDADGLLDALVRSCELEPARGGPPAAGPAEGPAERWDAWRSTSLSHRCFWVSGWPDPDHGGAVLERLSNTPAALTSVALLLAPAGDVTEVRCLARLAAEPGALAGVCAAAAEQVERVGGELLRLDGEQAPAVYASAPTGGGAR